MTEAQFALTLYVLAGLSTLGIYAINTGAFVVGTGRDLGGLYVSLILSIVVFSCWPPFFALWLLLPVLPYAKEKRP